MAGMLGDECLATLPVPNPPLRQMPESARSRSATFLSNPRFTRLAIKRSKTGRIGCGDAQGIRSERRSRQLHPFRANHGRVVRRRDRRPRPSPPADRCARAMAMTCSSACCGGGLQLLKWQRLEGADGDAGRRALPVHVVNNVARPACRTGTADARDADRAEAIDEHARLSGFVVETDAAFNEFLVALQHPGAHAARTRRASGGTRIRAKRTGNFMRERRSSIVAAPAEKICSAPSKSTGCSAIFAGAVRRWPRTTKRGPPTAPRPRQVRESVGTPRRSAAPDRSCSDRSLPLPPAQSRLSPRFPKSSRRRPIPCVRRASSRRHAATTRRLDQTGSGSRTCVRSDRRTARVHARGRVGQDERLANFEVLDDERRVLRTTARPLRAPFPRRPPPGR